MNTPLDILIIEIQQALFNIRPENPTKLSFVGYNLQIMRTIYTEMLTYNFSEEGTKRAQGVNSVTVEEYALNHSHQMNRAVLNYLSLLSLLNQFGRVLNNHYGLDLNKFPSYYRIKFYRDRAGEHWEDYINFISSRGITFQSGKAPIPTIENVEFQYREKIKKQLVVEFKKKNKTVTIPKKFVESMMLGSKSEYSNFIYSQLESIDPTLGISKSGFPIGDSLVSLLFEFGFPSPITDVEDYLKILSVFLRGYLNDDLKTSTIK